MRKWFYIERRENDSVKRGLRQTERCRRIEGWHVLLYLLWYEEVHCGGKVVIKLFHFSFLLFKVRVYPPHWCKPILIGYYGFKQSHFCITGCKIWVLGVFKDELKRTYSMFFTFLMSTFLSKELPVAFIPWWLYSCFTAQNILEYKPTQCTHCCTSHEAITAHLKKTGSIGYLLMTSCCSREQVRISS